MMVFPVVVLSEKSRQFLATFSYWLHASGVICSLCLVSFIYATFYNSPVYPFLDPAPNGILIVYGMWSLVFNVMGCLTSVLQGIHGLRFQIIPWVKIFVFHSTVFVFISSIALVNAAVFYATSKNQFKENLRKALNNYDYFGDDAEKWVDKERVDWIQSDYKCCGLEKGYKDYLNESSTPFILHHWAGFFHHTNGKKALCTSHKLQQSGSSRVVPGGRFSCYIPRSCCNQKQGLSCKPTYTMEAQTVLDKRSSGFNFKSYNAYMDKTKDLFYIEGCVEIFQKENKSWVNLILSCLLLVIPLITLVLCRLVQTSQLMSLWIPRGFFKRNPGWLFSSGKEAENALKARKRDDPDEYVPEICTMYYVVVAAINLVGGKDGSKESDFYPDHYNKMRTTLSNEDNRELTDKYSEAALRKKKPNEPEEKIRQEAILKEMQKIHEKFWSERFRKFEENFPTAPDFPSPTVHSPSSSETDLSKRSAKKS